MKAIYDNQPSKYEENINGSHTYRWNIKEVEVNHDGVITTQWECNEVVIWTSVSRSEITRCVLASLWDSDYEAKLLNDYNAATNNILSEDEAKKAIDDYVNFLTERKAVKEMVLKDCEELGIN